MSYLKATIAASLFLLGSQLLYGQFISGGHLTGTGSVVSGCSLADGHDHAAMVAIDCFPDAINTGVPSGTSLTAYSGANPITSNGTTIDAKTFTDCPLTIEATGVTITNSRFSCSPAASAISVDDQAEYTEASNGTAFLLTLKDSEIICGTTASGVGKTGILESYVKIVRVEITHCENGTSTNQKFTAEDSYLHDLATDFGGSHSDGGEASCGHWEGGGGPGCSAGCCIGYHRGSRNITWTHNTIFGRSNGDATDETSGLIFNHGGDPDANVTVQYNLMSGGSHAIYCVQNGVAGTNFQVLTNHFTTQFNANVGVAGPSDNCSDETLSGNVYHPAHTPITLAYNPIQPFHWLFKTPILYAWFNARLN